MEINKHANYFKEVSGENLATNVALSTYYGLQGKQLSEVTNNAIWCTFDSLCSDPRSQVDYIELAQIYETVLISDIPIMDGTMDDYCRRFISLIDEFYDRKVKVIMSAEGAASDLYKGSKLSEEFRRTTSRIAEMQTQQSLYDDAVKDHADDKKKLEDGEL